MIQIRLTQGQRRQVIFSSILMAIILVVISGCREQSPEVVESANLQLTQTSIFYDALLTATFSVAEAEVASSTPLPPEPTATPSSSPTLIPPTPEGTPLPLTGFQTNFLATGVDSKSYLEDTCSYLQQRWDPENSQPGTVVMPVMFHAIMDDSKEILDSMHVNKKGYYDLVINAHSNDFEVITSQQLSDFLYHNAKIPQRSMILIVDDRHKEAYFREFFLPYYDEYGWIVTNAWISTPLSSEDLWQQQIKMAGEGYVDYQAHGVEHNIPIRDYDSNQTITSDTYGTLPADEYIFHEINDPISIYQERFGIRPIAFIWPGGGFGVKGVNVAREAGYQVGFTVFDRGPLMFNWIPLGEDEQAVNDPLLVLPRFWSSSAVYRMEEVIQISEEAMTFASQNRQQELDWYKIYCPHYPPISIAE
jgi:hypothetical protein